MDKYTKMEQGDLFGSDRQAHASPPSKNAEEKPRLERIQSQTVTLVPKKKLAYADYLRIHCGNKLAANYWYVRNEGRPIQ